MGVLAGNELNRDTRSGDAASTIWKLTSVTCYVIRVIVIGHLLLSKFALHICITV